MKSYFTNQTYNVKMMLLTASNKNPMTIVLEGLKCNGKNRERVEFTVKVIRFLTFSLLSLLKAF
jgi:hypothetical protein